jgi:glycosyltransferase involved in cell wall biosynthesis
VEIFQPCDVGTRLWSKLVTCGRILHICSDYARQGLYPQLFAAIQDAGIEQSVYVPVRTIAELSVPRPPRAAIGYRASYILRPVHRLLFRTKTRVITADLLQTETLDRYAVIHAHFLYSDGAVALRLHEKSGIPYIAAVRSTDLNFFMRIRPDLRWVMHRIARAARALVFLSPTYREQFLERLPNKLASSVSARCVLIPNGLSPEWLEAPPAPSCRERNAPLRILFVGDFSENKNVLRLIEATNRIAQQRPVRLSLVGGGGADNGVHAVESKLSTGRFPWVHRLGRIEDPARLRAIYREHDVFAMPSFHETFGLVYIEAWSQGLPVILSQGQGVDRYFPPNTIAEAVDPRSVDSITRGLLAAADRADTYRQECINAAKTFSWQGIAGQYGELYQSIICNTANA